MSELNIPENLFHETGYKTVNGIPHFYRKIGQGEPFILLHGGPGMWHDELIPSFLDFARSHQAIFYDQRGNGKSLMEKIDSSNFTTALLVEDLEQLRQEFTIDRLNLIGHSWGGLLALYYAARYPLNMKRLVLSDPAPVNIELLMASYENLVGRFSPEEWNYLQELYETEAYQAGDPDSHNEAMRLSEGVTFYNETARDEYFKIAIFDDVKAKSMAAISGPSRDMKINVTVEDQLSNITCPTLIIQGQEDFIVPESARHIHQLIKGSQLAFIEKSGHYPFMEAPRPFFEALNTFIESPFEKR